MSTYPRRFGVGLLAYALLLLLVVGMATQEAYPAIKKEGTSVLKSERLLREALTESLKAEVERICKELGSTPPTVAVEADLSRLLAVFPEQLSTSPTVRCHRVPCIAITADSWPHLAEVYAKSDDAVRRIALEVGLSRKENAMTVASASVKSIDDYGTPAISLAVDGTREFSLNLCGVRVSLKTAQACVVDVAGQRLGALFEGEGELRLEPTCAKSRKMLVDFVPEPDKPIAITRVFVTCPFKDEKREPRQIKQLRLRVQELKEEPKGESDQQVAESMEKFLGDCIKSVYPLTEEKALEGLAPYAGYEYPMLVVQTEELGVFGFCFAGERGSETVMMTSPWTGAPVSYWESSGVRHEWIIPDAERYDFQVAWHPDRLRLAVKCKVAASRLEPGRDIRFMLNSACKVQSCRINEEETPFMQGKLAVDDSIASALACGYPPMSMDGFLQLSAPKSPIVGGEANVSIEYSMDYRDTSTIEMLGEGYWVSFCEDGLSLNGFCEWFPLTRWRSEAPRDGGMTFEIEVPTGFTAIAQGYPKSPETKKNTTVWRYTADFPTPLPSLAVGRFEEFVDDEFEPQLVVFTRSGEVVGRRWLDALSLVVAWAEKYCGKYAYKRLALVQATPGDVGSISWPSMLTMTDMVNPTHLWWQLSHEVSHQWWGDAARMLDIDDVWLQEGTAVYFNMLFSEDLKMRKPGVRSFKSMAAWIRKLEGPPPISAGFRLGQRCGAILFSTKGAYLYHILRMATNNDRHFFATLKRFQLDSQKVGLTEAGLKAAFEKATGHDLSGLFRLYVHTGDLPGVLVEVTDVATEVTHATISLSAQITPGGFALPYPIDVYPKSGQAPHRAVVFIGPDFGDYKLDVPFADISRIVGNPEAMLLVADADQEDVELYVGPK
ncbi:MAG TPA: M1 family aminopeptidase [bacterium]|nr:M1 family aminopeptidase [bacterium]